MDFEHVLHPRTKAILDGSARPAKVNDLRNRSTPLARINTRLGLGITIAVGTMWAAYIFALIALLSLPSALATGNLTIIVAWISSNFLQLVLLPIIIVGQNIQAKASDERAADTYKDAEAVLHEALQIQAHLKLQDDALNAMIAAHKTQEDALKAIIAAHSAPA
ncbi:MAG: hypothetical protein WAO09_03030 [Candidatus Dormiibacterota bacterium]|jgi:hypothetical protein